MAAAIQPLEPPTIKDLAQKSLQANKDHQYALQVYTERLEAELEAVDKLLVSICMLLVIQRLKHEVRQHQNTQMMIRKWTLVVLS